MVLVEPSQRGPFMSIPSVETPSVIGPSSGQVVASYRTYPDAQRAADRLSDAEFPVAHVRIVGHDLELIETITGRMTNARSAAAGAASSAWFGVFIGLLVCLFTRASVTRADARRPPHRRVVGRGVRLHGALGDTRHARLHVAQRPGCRALRRPG